jgi:hypothetical protein
MYGVAGIVNSWGKPVLEQELQDVCRRMVHRSRRRRVLRRTGSRPLHAPLANDQCGGTMSR